MKAPHPVSITSERQLWALLEEDVPARRRASWRALVLAHPLAVVAPVAAAVTWALLSLLVPQ
jgi:hypothetical protein